MAFAEQMARKVPREGYVRSSSAELTSTSSNELRGDEAPLARHVVAELYVSQHRQ